MPTNREEELVLIQRIREGDTASFRILVDRYKGVSFSLACSLLKSEQDAEDALQEAFVKAFRGLRNFKHTASFSTWLYRIVVNTCNTRFQKQKRRNELIDVDSRMEVEVVEANTPFRAIDLQERKAIVNLVLERMTGDEALLLRLFYLAERSVEEIKEITGFKESKIKVTLHRGRQRFKKILEQGYGFEIKE